MIPATVPGFALVQGFRPRWPREVTACGQRRWNPEEVRLKQERVQASSASLRFGAEPCAAIQAAVAEATSQAGCDVGAEVAPSLAPATI